MQHTSESSTSMDCRDTVYCVTFFPDGKQVVTGGKEMLLHHWKSDGREIGELMYTGSPCQDLRISKDSNWIVSASHNGQVTVWRANHQRVHVISAHTDIVTSIDISPDSTQVVSGSGDQMAYVWDLQTGQQLFGPLMHPDAIVATRFSPNRDYIATATWKDRHIYIYTIDGSLIHDIPVLIGNAWSDSLAWSLNGQRLFILAKRNRRPRGGGRTVKSGHITCVDASDGSLLFEWKTHYTQYPGCLALAANGKFFAATASNSIAFWDMSTHRRIGPTLKHTSACIWTMALSPDDCFLGVGGEGREITLYSLQNVLPSFYLEPAPMAWCPALPALPPPSTAAPPLSQAALPSPSPPPTSAPPAFPASNFPPPASPLLQTAPSLSTSPVAQGHLAERLQFDWPELTRVEAALTTFQAELGELYQEAQELRNRLHRLSQGT